METRTGVCRARARSNAPWPQSSQRITVAASRPLTRVSGEPLARAARRAQSLPKARGAHSARSVGAGRGPGPLSAHFWVTTLPPDLAQQVAELGGDQLLER